MILALTMELRRGAHSSGAALSPPEPRRGAWV